MAETTSMRSPRKKWTGVLAAAFLAGVLGAGTVVAVVGFGGQQAAPAPRPPAPPPPSAPTSQPPQGDQSLPVVAPPVTWKLFHGAALPYSNEAGPHQVRGAVAADFQRSPVGALVAAVHINTRRVIAPGQGWRAVTEQQILPGPGRATYLQARSQVSGTVPTSQIAQIAGFRFVTYSPDMAVIQLASRAQNGQLQATTTTVRWSGGDWKLELQPNGGSSPGVQPLQDLTYYTPWSGV